MEVSGQSHAPASTNSVIQGNRRQRMNRVVQPVWTFTQHFNILSLPGFKPWNVQPLTRMWRLLHFLPGATALPPPQWAMASSFTRFLHHTQRRTTVGRTPLDEWSARSQRTITDNTHTTDRRCMLPMGFEPTISAGERPQTHAFRPLGHWDYYRTDLNVL